MEENGEASLLAATSAGDRSAFDELFPLAYDEFREIAHRHLRGEPTGQTLAVAARAMRRVKRDWGVARGWLHRELSR